MKNKTIVGIDPGQKGAIAVFSPDGTLDIWDMKPLIVATGSFKSLDANRLDALIGSAIPDPENALVFCEESLIVHGNGIKTARPIFDARGVMRAVLALRGVKMEYVSPIAWKRYYGLTKASKADSVEKAIELLPKYADFFRKEYRKRIIDLDGRAEAALIGLYGKATKGGKD